MGDLSRAQQLENWNRGVAEIRASPELFQDILDSVMSSMAYEGFSVNRERSRELLEMALSGPPLIFPSSGDPE